MYDFLADGIELPVSHHQSVHTNGTLTISAVTRAADEGTYSCSANDKQGRSDTQELTLQIEGESLPFIAR